MAEYAVRENLLTAADEARSGHLRWPHDEMCLARWDGFADAACIALGMTKAELVDELERIARA